MTKPWRRASIGTYEAVIDGQRVVFQRDGGRGFILRMGKGSISQRRRRLRDAYDLAVGAVRAEIFSDGEHDNAAMVPARPRLVGAPREAVVETDPRQMWFPFVTGGGGNAMRALMPCL